MDDLSSLDLSVDLGGLTLKNPVTAASGTFGFGSEYLPAISPEDLGAVSVKGLTLSPRKGNSGVRIHETPSGLMNSIGLENPGLDYFIDHILPKLNSRGVVTFANISGNTDEEYLQMAEKLSACTGISALEVNISCPNVDRGGITYGVDPNMTYQLVSKVTRRTSLPVIVKLSPNVTDITVIAEAAEMGGASALSMINTVTGAAIDIDYYSPVFERGFAGLSGPAIKPIGVKAVYQTAQAVNIPIIGMGGIVDYRDAVEYILAGASAVAVGTSNFINPSTSKEIIQGIASYMQDHNFLRVEDVIGLAIRREKNE